MPLTDWRDHAACADMGPDPFFPERGGSFAEARKACARCPVRTPCLEEELAIGARFDLTPDGFLDHGYRGGTTAKERRQIRAQRRRNPALALAVG